MEIIMGDATSDGRICLLIDNPDIEEERSTLAFYRSGSEQGWTRIDHDAKIVSVCRAPDMWEGRSDFLGLTGEGDIYFLPGGESMRIPGSGLTEPDSRGFGRMTDLVYAGDQLLALGFGGQAYLLSADGSWRPLAETFPQPAQPNDTIRFKAAAYQASKQRFVLGGQVSAGLIRTEELRQANARNDATAIFQLLMAQDQKDYGALWLCDGVNWVNVEIPTNNTVDEIIVDRGSITYLRVRGGVVYSTVDFDELIEVATADTDEGFAAMCTSWGLPLLADERTLRVMPTRWSRPLPTATAGDTRVHGGSLPLRP